MVQMIFHNLYSCNTLKNPECFKKQRIEKTKEKPDEKQWINKLVAVTDIKMKVIPREAKMTDKVLQISLVPTFWYHKGFSKSAEYLQWNKFNYF